MIPCDKAFGGKSFFEFQGRTFYRWHYIRKLGDYTLRLKIISTNSPHGQGVAICFSKFQGTLVINGQVLPIPKKRFGHYIVKDGDAPDNTFDLELHVESGCIFLGNASERKEIGTYTCGSFANAFWIEEFAKDSFRFHCNDHEPDDDFDDMIFEMTIISPT